MKSLPFGDPKKSEATATLTELSVDRDGQRLSLYEPSGPIALRADDLTIPDLHLELKTRSGLSARFGAGGAVRHVMTRAELDLGFRLDPLDLSRLSSDIPQIARASGTIEGALRATGSPSSPHYAGSMHLKKGELAFKGSPISLDDLFVDVEIGNGEVRMTRGTATVGGGTVSVKARLPVHGLELGTATATITARGLKLPVADGVDLTADGDLEATYRPGASDIAGEKNLPDVKGTVSLTSFNYTRPITMSVNLSQLTGKSQRTNVETYDPNDDFVRFHVTLVSPRPLRFSNNLVDMQLEVAQPGVVLSGTNQRFGAQGHAADPARLQAQAPEHRVRGARGLRALRRSGAHLAEGRRARGDRVPARGGDRGQRRGNADVGRHGGHQHRRAVAHQPARARRAREPEGRAHQRSAARPGRHRPLAHDGHDARRDRSRRSPRRSGRPWAWRPSRSSPAPTRR